MRQQRSEVEEFFDEDKLDEVDSEGPAPPAHDDGSPTHEPAFLKHMVGYGSYYYHGYVWSERAGQIQATDQHKPKQNIAPLKESDIEYLLKLEHTIPSNDHSKRKVVKRFALLTARDIEAKKAAKRKKLMASESMHRRDEDEDDEPRLPATRAPKPAAPKAKAGKKADPPRDPLPKTPADLTGPIASK